MKDLLELFEATVLNYCGAETMFNFPPWRANYILSLLIEDYGLHLEGLPAPEDPEENLLEFRELYVLEELFQEGWLDLDIERYSLVFDKCKECWQNFLLSDSGRDHFLRFSVGLGKILEEFDLDIVAMVIG